MNIKKFLFCMFFIMIAVVPVFTFAQTFDRDLYFGIQNDSDVTKLQEFLTDEGLYSGPITGNFFSLTLSGVKAFQNREGITPVAGYFGPKTRTRANQILASQIQASENQAVIETGTTTPIAQAPKTSNDLYSLLLQLVALMQQNNQSSNTQTQTQQSQLQTSQQTQQIVQNIQNELSQQNQTLQQIQQNTAWTPTPTPTVIPISSTPTSTPSPTPIPTLSPSPTPTPVVDNSLPSISLDSSSPINPTGTLTSIRNGLLVAKIILKVNSQTGSNSLFEKFAGLKYIDVISSDFTEQDLTLTTDSDMPPLEQEYPVSNIIKEVPAYSQTIINIYLTSTNGKTGKFSLRIGGIEWASEYPIGYPIGQIQTMQSDPNIGLKPISLETPTVIINE